MEKFIHENMKKFLTEGKKYSITNETMTLENGTVLHRIKAEKDIPFDRVHKIFRARKGDFGGWIESEENLPQDGLCWVKGDAKVYGNATVCGDAQIADNVEVFDNAVVSEGVFIYHNAKIFNNAKVSCSIIKNDVKIYENAVVTGGFFYKNVQVYGNAIIENGDFSGNAKIYDNAYICGRNVGVNGNVQIFENAKITGNTVLLGNSKVCGDAQIATSTTVFFDDKVMDHGIIDNKYIYGESQKPKDNQKAIKEYFESGLDEEEIL